MRVLICGGRDFDDAGLLERTLNAVHSGHGIRAIIHGDAPGADRLAGMWARSRQASGPVEEVACPAAWETYGRKAGPIRNQYMLSVHRPDLVIAFRGGRGTADMIRRAEAAGVLVIRVGSDLSLGAAG